MKKAEKRKPGRPYIGTKRFTCTLSPAALGKLRQRAERHSLAMSTIIDRLILENV